MAASSYDESLRRLLEHEGGYTNHPSDPGGPTNFGITIHDYRKYVNPNATAADVRSMPIEVAKRIYREKYWNAIAGDDLPPGIDYCVFDYTVNSGIGRAPKVLQRILGVEADGKIGPVTLAAASNANPVTVINAICDERLAFLRGLSTWGDFGNGWGRRVREVRAGALEIAKKSPVKPSDGIPPWLATMREITGTLEAPGAADNPKILAWRDEIARRYPEMAKYCREYTHDSIPWCGLTVAYCMAKNGIRPVFGPAATDKFLWAAAWRKFGTVLSKPKLGCVMVFTRDGGGHVALYEGEEGGYYLIRGGNQSNAVNVTRYPKSKFTAAVWPGQSKTVETTTAVVVGGGGAVAAAEASRQGVSAETVLLIAGAAVILAIAAFIVIRRIKSK